ncbi:MAG: BrnT family toxin [Acetobacteraceae bacterium]|jgi:uncharacterized DUF497 family protein
MRITWRIEKERRNISKHGLDFSLAAQVFADPLAETVWDRFVDGEERWRTFGGVTVGGRFMVVVVVHTYPDPDDETRVHVIGLREATAHERKRYEISQL